MENEKFLNFFQAVFPTIMAIVNGEQDVVYGSYIIGKKYEECCEGEIHEEFTIFKMFYSKVKPLAISAEWKRNNKPEIVAEIQKYSDLYFQDLLEVCFVIANKYA